MTVVKGLKIKGGGVMVGSLVTHQHCRDLGILVLPIFLIMTVYKTLYTIIAGVVYEVQL